MEFGPGSMIAINAIKSGQSKDDGFIPDFNVYISSDRVRFLRLTNNLTTTQNHGKLKKISKEKVQSNINITRHHDVDHILAPLPTKILWNREQRSLSDDSRRNNAYSKLPGSINFDQIQHSAKNKFGSDSKYDEVIIMDEITSPMQDGDETVSL